MNKYKQILAIFILSLGYLAITACSDNMGYTSLDPAQNTAGKQLETAPPPPGAAR